VGRVGSWSASGEVDWTGTVPSQSTFNKTCARPPTAGPRESSRRTREDAACHPQPHKSGLDLSRVWVVLDTAAIHI
jgi:hypothetical protein